MRAAPLTWFQDECDRSQLRDSNERVKLASSTLSIRPRANADRQFSSYAGGVYSTDTQQLKPSYDHLAAYKALKARKMEVRASQLKEHAVDGELLSVASKRALALHFMSAQPHRLKTRVPLPEDRGV